VSARKRIPVIVDKTKLGINFFDTCFGGVYRGRQSLCSGRNGSGKSILAFHFLAQALQDGDKALLLSPYRAHDTIIIAESVGLPFAEAVSSGRLTLLEYTSFISENNISTNVMLPPESFMELQETIESQSIRRLVFDTALPWVAVQPVTRIAEHVYSFIHALDRLGVTSLLTLPKPVSNPAFTLKSRLEDLCPVVINLDHTSGANRVLRVTKYLGEVRNLSTPIPFVIMPGKGIVAESEAPAGDAPAPVAPNTALSSPPSQTGAQASKPITFSSVIKFPE